MYGNMSMTSKNGSFDNEIPSTSDETMPQLETDGLLLYSEKDIKGRVRKSVFVTVGICLLLALVGMSAALIHARARNPDEAMQMIVKEFQANNDKAATGNHVSDGSGSSNKNNNQNRELYSSYCYEYTAVYADYDYYQAAYACVDALYYYGCYGGTPYITNYYQYYYGDYWYVQCYCDC
jgi:hypothetical protein